MRTFPERGLRTFAWLLRLFLVAVAVRAWRRGELYFAGSALALLAATLVPVYLERSGRMRAPVGLQAILATLVALHVAGLVVPLYGRVPGYDRALHALAGAALGSFALLFARARGLAPSRPPVDAALAVFFTVTGGVAWEVFEFGCDVSLGTTNQVGNVDTMGDLVADTGGAVAGVAATSALLARGALASTLRALAGQPTAGAHPRERGAPWTATAARDGWGEGP